MTYILDGLDRYVLGERNDLHLQAFHKESDHILAGYRRTHYDRVPSSVNPDIPVSPPHGPRG